MTKTLGSVPGCGKIVVIAGPTASGKSALAIRLALEEDGEILNADSMQVYLGMDIGTAKPTREERAVVPHHLLDVMEPDQEFNASIFRAMALPILEDMAARGKLRLVVGGTGLYIRALVGGLFDCGPADPALRRSLLEECRALGSERLHERLSRVDPAAAARIHPRDRVRIVRALEVFLQTGQPFSEWARGHGFGAGRFRVLKLCLQMERAELYRRIDQRCEDMIRAGLLEETEALLCRGYGPHLKPMKAIGYRHMVGHLQGRWTMEEALLGLKRDTRRYAKRQVTWFRADPDVNWVSPDDTEGILRRVRAFAGKPLTPI
jgi:tRNA dimethylallyltransferase